MRALHFSYFNTVNVPLTYCELYRRHGHEARLLTLYKHRGGIPEDICLNKKIFNPTWLKAIRQRRERGAEAAIQRNRGAKAPFEYRPSGFLEAAILSLRDFARDIEFRGLSRQYDLYGFDIYHFHGGIDFFRDSRWVRRLARMGKPIVVHYHGPDLRGRGIVAEVDQASGLDLTNEFDLLDLHPDLHYIPIPFDCASVPSPAAPPPKIRILHTPSNPAAKGTHLIEPVLQQVARERDVDVAILTGISREEVIRQKAMSHVLVEQVGNCGGTGYGVNSLEALAMNIPVVTEFIPEYESFLSGHPFVLATPATLHDALLRLIDDREYRTRVAARGRQWVEAEHGFDSVWKRMIGLLAERVPAVAERLGR